MPREGLRDANDLTRRERTDHPASFPQASTANAVPNHTKLLTSASYDLLGQIVTQRHQAFGNPLMSGE